MWTETASAPDPTGGGWTQPRASLGEKDFEEAQGTQESLLGYHRENNSQHTESSNLHSSVLYVNKPFPSDQYQQKAKS